VKVLTVCGDALVEPLAEQPDVEQFALVSPQNVDRLGRLERVKKTFPYRAATKLHPPTIFNVRRAIQEVRPDVVHAFFSRPLAHVLLATTGMRDAPPIVSFRAIATPPSRFDPADRISYLHRRVDAHACEAWASARGLLAAGVPRERCFVSYRYSDCPKQSPGRAGLEPWDVPPDAFVVASRGSFRPVKGADVLIRAAIECSDLRDIYWLLIGPIRDKRLATMVREPRIRDRVRCLGYQEAGRELISGADLFAMASWSEGIPTALLEAMWQGVCPVVTAAGGMPEVVVHGQSGLVVSKGDHRALSAAIRSLHQNRDRLLAYGQAARRRMERDFTPAAFASRVMDIYRRVLKQGSGYSGFRSQEGSKAA
jgi:glycosyltransferase involved in cell wall biosynthesis